MKKLDLKPHQLDAAIIEKIAAWLETLPGDISAQGSAILLRDKAKNAMQENEWGAK